MKIENAKTNIKIEKAYRLGRKKDGATRPRPIVVKFGSYEREMVRNLSKRLKGTNFGISPHYPPEVLEKRRKLIPVMLKQRQENKKAYIVGVTSLFTVFVVSIFFATVSSLTFKDLCSSWMFDKN
jgi:hypothetical protein